MGLIMEKKTIDSTLQRPEGGRVINAPLVELNLHKFIDLIKNETTWANSDRNSITLFKSEEVTIVLIGLHKNTAIKQNKTNGVISIQVLEGSLQFITQQQKTVIGTGQMIVIQANITHRVIARTESIYLLTVNNELT